MKNILLTITIAILSSSAFTVAVTAVIDWIREKKNKKTGASAGIRILLYDRIKHLGKAYIERGSITAEELEDLIEMHRIYHDELNGNGFLDAIMDQVKKLPIINERR